MKRKNMTFSIPEDLKAVLYAHVGKMNISRFISSAVRKSLEEEAVIQEKELDAKYDAANQDSDRIKTIQEWDHIDDISDLIVEDEDWAWLRDPRENKRKLKHG